MTPLTVFFRTLAEIERHLHRRAGFVILHPSLDCGRAVVARDARHRAAEPAEAAVDGLIGALKDTDAGVRRQAADALGELQQCARGARR